MIFQVNITDQRLLDGLEFAAADAGKTPQEYVQHVMSCACESYARTAVDTKEDLQRKLDVAEARVAALEQEKAK